MGSRRRHTQKQKIWNYIRRNRVFRAGDIQSILEVNPSTLRVILSDLVRMRAIRRVNAVNKVVDREYESLLVFTYWYPLGGSHEKT